MVAWLAEPQKNGVPPRGSSAAAHRSADQLRICRGAPLPALPTGAAPTPAAEAARAVAASCICRRCRRRCAWGLSLASVCAKGAAAAAAAAPAVPSGTPAPASGLVSLPSSSAPPSEPCEPTWIQSLPRFRDGPSAHAYWRAVHAFPQARPPNARAGMTHRCSCSGLRGGLRLWLVRRLQGQRERLQRHTAALSPRARRHH
jgi:hypothetical protein